MSNDDLKKRLEIEEQFHDSKGAGDATKSNRVSLTFYDHAFRDIDDAAAWLALGDLHGLRVLEIGCGKGWKTVELAKRGALVTGLDISEEMLERMMRYAEKHGVADRVQPLHCAVEELRIEQGAAPYDIVAGYGVLHHLELETALPRIHAVLKPGGKAVFVEPMGHNIFLRSYRWLTPNRRTPTEHPLLMHDFELMRKYFTEVNHEEFHLLTFIAFFWRFVFKNQERFERSIRFWREIEKELFQKFPSLKRQCWVTVIQMVK